MTLWEPPKTRPVVPDHPPELLRGRTAADWTIRSGIYFAVALLPMVGMAMRSVLPESLDGLDILVSVVALAVCLAKAMRASIGAYSATKAELQAGYTTLTVPDRPYVWLLNRKTGAVLRQPDPSRRPPWY